MTAAAGILEQIQLGDLGLAGLVTLFVVLVLTGKLVPKATVEQMRSDKDAICVAERDAKQAASHVVSQQEKIIHDQAETIRDLASAARVGVRVGEHVQSLTGGANVAS